MAISTIDNNGVNLGQLGNRNLIINGNMQVAQRGTSQSAAGYGTLDRFELSLSGASATMTQESFTIGQTDVPGSDKYLKLVVSTGNNHSGVYHKVEAKNAFSIISKKVTLSYYAKGTSPAAGLETGILWYDGSSVSSTSSTAVTLTSSWTKYIHTFDVPSISGLTLTNAAAYLEVHWIQSGSDTGTGAYEVNLAQVQLEAGDTDTPFEHKPISEELAACQRYFQYVYDSSTSAIAPGRGASGGDALVVAMPIPVVLRTTPAVASTGSYYVYDPNSRNNATPTSVTVSNYPTNGSLISLYFAFSGVVCDDDRVLLIASQGTTTLTLDAEL